MANCICFGLGEVSLSLVALDMIPVGTHSRVIRGTRSPKEFCGGGDTFQA